MKKICILLILLIAILFFLTGCYDAVSLEKYAYVMAIAIDSSETSNIKLTVQVASSSQSSDSSSSSQSTTNEIFSADCETINIGLNIINNFLSKKLNLSHCTAIIFSEDIAKKGVENYINSLANNPEIRPGTHVLICQTKATDILDNVSKSGEQFSSRYYEFVINSVESTGYSAQSEFGRFFYDMNSNLQIPTANYITVTNDGVVQSVGIALFKGDKFQTFLNPLESLAHLITTNHLQESIITIPNPYNENSSMDISIKKLKNSKHEIKLINGKPFIESKIYISGKIVNMPSLSENDNLKVIEESLNNYIEALVENYYYVIIKKYNLDLANFSDTISSNYLTQSDFEKINWNNIYKDSFYNVSVSSKVNTNIFTKK